MAVKIQKDEGDDGAANGSSSSTSASNRKTRQPSPYARTVVRTTVLLVLLVSLQLFHESPMLRLFNRHVRTLNLSSYVDVNASTVSSALEDVVGKVQDLTEQAAIWLLSSSATSKPETSSSSSIVMLDGPPTNDHQIPTRQLTQFCVSWQVEMDDWWLHNVEWDIDILHQTSTRQCFVKRYNGGDGRIDDNITTGTNTDNNKMTTPNDFLQRLHALQFNTTQNCSDVAYRSFQGGGYGANIYSLWRHLVSCFVGGKSMVISRYREGAMWNYAHLDGGNSTCPQADMSCYFLPINHCSVPTTTTYENGTTVTEPAPEIIGMTGNIPKVDRPPRFLMPEFQSWFIWYLTRPKQWVRRRVQQYLEDRMVNYQIVAERLQQRELSQQQNGSDVGSELGDLCTVLHIRRTDILLDRDGRQYYPLADYLSAIPIRNVTGSTTATAIGTDRVGINHVSQEQPNLVVVLTDDASTIDEFALFSQEDYIFVYSNKTRFRGTEGGHSGHVPTQDPTEEFVCMLAEFQIAQMCGRTLIQTRSGFAMLIHEYMNIANFNQYHQEQQEQQPTTALLGSTSSTASVPTPTTTGNGINIIRIDTLNTTKGARIMEKEFFDAHQERLKKAAPAAAATTTTTK